MAKQKPHNDIVKAMSSNIKTSTSVAFWVCIIASIALFVGSFFVPPMGVIDGSVLKAVSLLFGFAAVAIFREAIHEGLGAKIRHNSTEIEITND